MQLLSTFYLFSMADVSHSTQCSSFPSQAKQKKFSKPIPFPSLGGGQQPKRRINFRMQLEIDKQAFHKLDTVDDVALGDSDLFPGESEKKEGGVRRSSFSVLSVSAVHVCFHMSWHKTMQTQTFAKPSMRRKHSETFALVGNPTGNKHGVCKEF